MKKPKISIIIPAYNVENYIAKALLSCINQSFKDIEIIVVDDRGQDESIKIAQIFAAYDERIKIIHNPCNLKLFKTRFEGAKAANADYIMFLDGDDFLDEKACEVCANILEKEPDLDLLAFNFMSQSSKTLEFEKSFRVYDINKNLSVKEFIEYLFFKNGVYSAPFAKVFSRNLFVEIFTKEFSNTQKLSMAEDVLMFFAYLRFVKKVRICDNFLYYYRYNIHSLSNGAKNMEKVDEINIVINLLQEFCKNTSSKIYLYLCTSRIFDVKLHRLELLYHTSKRSFLQYLNFKIKRKFLKRAKKLLLKQIQNKFNQ